MISKNEMYRKNIISVKVSDENRSYRQTLGGLCHKTIKRTSYLKICWMCGKAYESYRYDSSSCSPRCSSNLYYARNRGLDPPARMDELTKPRNTKEIRDQKGYR